MERIVNVSLAFILGTLAAICTLSCALGKQWAILYTRGCWCPPPPPSHVHADDCQRHLGLLRYLNGVVPIPDDASVWERFEATHMQLTIYE